MSDAAVIKEFLVSLGFQIDPGSERRFGDAIGAATVKAVALGVEAARAAEAVVSAVARIAEGLEQLYFASQRTHASVENLQAVGFAARQLSGDAGAALNSVENLARFLRNSPGGEGLLKNLGIQTRDARGGMRDTVEMLGDLGKKFAAMPYYKANAFAQALGIDEKTLMAMRSGLGEFEAQYKGMLRAAGVDSQAAAKTSHEFMSELRLLGGAFGVLMQKVAASTETTLGANIKRMRENFVANFDRISAVVGKVIEFVMRVTDAIAILALRGAQALGWLVDWFRNLSPAAQNIIEIIGGILIAWKALSAGFLATPLGRVLALAAAIAGLVDDYMTWKEGGKSLFDWSALSPFIEATLSAVQRIGGAIHEGLSFLGDWRPAFELLLAYVAGAWLKGMLGSIGKVAAAQAAAGGGMGLAARAGLVGAAAVGGYALGTEINNHLSDGTKDTIGRSVAHVLAFFGNKDAQDALANEAGGARPGPARGPRGIRNNNPGNLEFGAFARAHGATGREAQGRFATFATAQAGLDALVALLRSKKYIGGGVDTLNGVMHKYAPANENKTSAYVAFIAKRLGIDPNAHIDPNNAQQMANLAGSIVSYENGKNPYSSEMIGRAVGAPVLTQSTTITVHGGGDPKGIARDVAHAQNGVNEQLVRNMRGAVLQ